MERRDRGPGPGPRRGVGTSKRNPSSPVVPCEVEKHGKNLPADPGGEAGEPGRARVPEPSALGHPDAGHRRGLVHV
jgi:hypothetical protein